MKLQFKVIHLVVALALTGCSQKSPEELLESAQQKIALKQTSGAIIDLKNAVLADPKSAEARYFLGKVYLDNGTAVPAEKELRLSLKLGYDSNLVLPLLAKALGLQDKHQAVIDLVSEANDLDPEALSSLLIYKALAHFQLGADQLAKMAVRDANEISSTSIFSQLGVAYVALNEKRVDESIEKVDQIINANPDFEEAYFLKGQLSLLAKDYAEAATSFEMYLSLLPEVASTRVFLSYAYINDEQLDKAERQLDILLSVNKDHPFVNQLKSMVKFKTQDFDQALLHSEVALQNGLNTNINKVIAGISAYQLGVLEKSYKYLKSINGSVPNDQIVRKVLAIVQIELGYDLEASETLSTIEGLTKEDTILLTTAGFNLVGLGRNQEAAELVQIASELNPEEAVEVAKIGMLKLSMEDLSGVIDLENALSKNDNLSQAKIALVRTFMDAEKLEEAFDIAEKWIESRPDDVSGYNIAASIFIKSKDTEKAEFYLQKALEVDSSNTLSVIYFAEKSEKSGNWTEALGMLEESLSVKPFDIPSLVLFNRISKSIGRAPEGMKMLSQAAEKSTEPMIDLLYAEALLDQGSSGQAIEILNKITNEDIKYLQRDLLAKAYISDNRPSDAFKLYQNWAEAEPLNKVPYLAEITLHDQYLQYQEALNAVLKAREKLPDDLQLRAMEIHYHIMLQNKEQAVSLLSGIKKIKSAAEVVSGLEGQVDILEGAFDKALPKLKYYYEFNPIPRNALLVANTMLQLGRTQEASDFMEKHLVLKPSHVTVREALAGLYVTLAPEKAIFHYRQILQQDSNTLALNNLAWLLGQKNELKEALEYIDAAYTASPNDLDVIDTYVELLLKSGQKNKALKIVNEGVTDKKNNPKYEYLLKKIDSI